MAVEQALSTKTLTAYSSTHDRVNSHHAQQTNGHGEFVVGMLNAGVTLAGTYLLLDGVLVRHIDDLDTGLRLVFVGLSVSD